MKLSLKQLEAFAWVSDLGSFRKAADRLNTTQPNISSRIAMLETQLNTTLMERDAGSVRLTAKGAQLLDHTRAVLAAVDALIAASGEVDLVDGTLRLGVTEMIVHTWLGAFLQALNTRFPKLHVELTVDLSATLETELSNNTLDLALQNGPFNQQSSGQEPLGEYPLIWVAAPEIAAPLGPRATSADLVRYPILTHARHTRLFAQIDHHFSRKRKSDVRLVPSSNLAACLHMTQTGMGIASLPAAMVKTELESGALVALDYEWHPEPLAFFARFDSARAPSYLQEAVHIAQTAAAQFGAGRSPQNRSMSSAL